MSKRSYWQKSKEAVQDEIERRRAELAGAPKDAVEKRQELREDIEALEDEGRIVEREGQIEPED